MFLVIGPGKCGSSAVAGILSKLGVDMGTFFKIPRPQEPYCDYEDLEFKVITYAMGAQAFGGDCALSILKRLGSTKKEPWGFKDPRIADHPRLFLKAFPDAVFVKVVRAKESVLSSMVKSYGWSPGDALSLIERRLMGILSMPENGCTVQWESLLESPEETIQGMCQALGLNYNPSCLDVLRTKLRQPQEQSQETADGID